MCQVSGVTFHISGVKKSDKGVEPVSGGCVINAATPSCSFLWKEVGDFLSVCAIP